MAGGIEVAVIRAVLMALILWRLGRSGYSPPLWLAPAIGVLGYVWLVLTPVQA